MLLANVGIEGKKPGEMDTFLFEYKIQAIGIDVESIKGVRITSNVYTTTKDLDLLVEAITAFAKS